MKNGEFEAGERVSFCLYNPNKDGSLTHQDKVVEVEAVKGGGFFGRVYIIKDQPIVIKTSTPNPWHFFWRLANWRFRKFPSQVSETQAKLDHLSMNLIHATVPVLTGGQVYTPRSLGYTEFDGGYAQVIEKMHGRGPRYDTSDDEFCQFRQKQRELKWLGYNLGLEQAAQIHEDNPFGMANLWRDPKNNCWIWLDTLPAIPHKGWIWPFFYFKFHKDVKNWFYHPMFAPREPTFNQIHVGFFMHHIAQNRQLFDSEHYQEIMDNLNLYQRLWIESEKEQTDRDIQGAMQALGQSSKDLAKKAANAAVDAIKTPVKVLFSSKYRNDLTLKGIRQGFEEGMVAKEELTAAEQIVMDQQLTSKEMWLRRVILSGLPISYQATGWLFLKPAELASYAYLAGSDHEGLLKSVEIMSTFALFRILGSILRPLTTALTGKFSGVDLEVATRISAIPIAGDWLAIPAQIGVTAGNRNDALWHYTVRNLIANLSAIFPDGGWGTQREGEWWQCLGKKIESWGKKKG